MTDYNKITEDVKKMTNVLKEIIEYSKKPN